MEWNKIINATLLPILVSIALLVIGYATPLLLGSAGLIMISIVSFIIILIISYAGYRGVKKYKLDLKSTAMIGFILGFVLTVLGVIAIYSLIANGTMPVTPPGGFTINKPGFDEKAFEEQVRQTMLGFLPILGVIAAVLNAVWGALLSAAGGVVAQRRKKS